MAGIRWRMEAQQPSTSDKSALIGAVAMLASFLLEKANVAVSAEEISTALSQAVDAIQILAGVGGFGIVVWGRWKAARTNKLSG